MLIRVFELRGINVVLTDHCQIGGIYPYIATENFESYDIGAEDKAKTNETRGNDFLNPIICHSLGLICFLPYPYGTLIVGCTSQ